MKVTHLVLTFKLYLHHRCSKIKEVWLNKCASILRKLHDFIQCTGEARRTYRFVRLLLIFKIMQSNNHGWCKRLTRKNQKSFENLMQYQQSDISEDHHCLPSNRGILYHHHTSITHHHRSQFHKNTLQNYSR